MSQVIQLVLVVCNVISYLCIVQNVRFSGREAHSFSTTIKVHCIATVRPAGGAAAAAIKIRRQ